VCGFVVVLTRDASFPRAVLDTMRDRLAHRGPDGCGSWIGRTPSGVVALGHRRLAIVDLSPAAAQPMFNTDGTLAIVLNGEIYNYVELREELRARGVSFRTQSDTEVLLAAYETWGENCLAHLNGMFAFAIWDGRRDLLFAARDRFGEKPFYWSRLPDGGLAMASEMKALFAHPSIEPEIDHEALQRFAEGGPLIPAETTLFSAVKCLPAATAWLIDPTGRVRRTWRYWVPDYENVRPDYREAVAVEEFRHLLEQSVRQRLRVDVKVGACLSGGLDSSTLVGILAGLRKRPEDVLNSTISARFDDDETISEGPFIDALIRHARVAATFVSPTGADLVDESRLLHWHQEIPFLSASIYLEWCVMRIARQQNSVVMIDGQGADELLAGYQFYFQLRQIDLMETGRVASLIGESVRFNRRLQRATRRYLDSRRRINPRIGYSLAQLSEMFFRTWRPSGEPRAAQAASDLRPGVPAPRPGNTLRRKLASELQYDMLPNQLHSADRSAMAFGVETRFPFLDHRLVDFCLGLPDEAFFRNGWQKYILRRAAKGFVPGSIQWRADKVGYAAPMDAWMRGPMREWGYERLQSGPASRLPYFDREHVARCWEEFQAGTADHSWELWRWISIGEWLVLAEDGIWKSGLKGQLAPAAEPPVRQVAPR